MHVAISNVSCINLDNNGINSCISCLVHLEGTSQPVLYRPIQHHLNNLTIVGGGKLEAAVTLGRGELVKARHRLRRHIVDSM